MLNKLKKRNHLKSSMSKKLVITCFFRIDSDSSMITQIHLGPFQKKSILVNLRRFPWLHPGPPKGHMAISQWILPDPRNGHRLVNPWLGSASHGLPLGAFLWLGWQGQQGQHLEREVAICWKIWWFSNYKFDKLIEKNKEYSFQQEYFG